MPSLLRAAAAGAVLLAGAGVAAIAWQLHRINAALDDPAAVIQPALDEYLAAVPADPGLRADDALLDRRIVVVTANINEHTAKDVAARLLYLDVQRPGQPIDLYLSTQGGWVDSAFTIIDVMEGIASPVNTWAVGGCYSAGTLILAAGTGRRTAAASAILMIHASLDPAGRQSYSYERLALERYERIWRERATLPSDWFPMVGGEEYYLSAEEALDFGLIDAIAPPRPGHHVPDTPPGPVGCLGADIDHG